MHTNHARIACAVVLRSITPRAIKGCRATRETPVQGILERFIVSYPYDPYTDGNIRKP